MVKLNRRETLGLMGAAAVAGLARPAIAQNRDLMTE